MTMSKNIIMNGTTIKQPIDIFFDVFRADEDCPLSEGTERDFKIKTVFFMVFLGVIQISAVALGFQILKIVSSIAIYIVAIELLIRLFRITNKSTKKLAHLGIFSSIFGLFILVILTSL